MPQRKFNLFELTNYTILWAVVIAIVGMDLENPPAVVAIPTLLLPGPLIGGPIGLLIWGRQAFLGAALVGLLVWILFLVYPAMDAVR